MKQQCSWCGIWCCHSSCLQDVFFFETIRVPYNPRRSRGWKLDKHHNTESLRVYGSQMIAIHALASLCHTAEEFLTAALWKPGCSAWGNSFFTSRFLKYKCHSKCSLKMSGSEGWVFVLCRRPSKADVDEKCWLLWFPSRLNIKINPCLIFCQTQGPRGS